MKPNILFWSDFFYCDTGFGRVTRNVMKKILPYYNIDHLAVNYNGRFFNTNEFPVQVSPARLQNPNDPYGRYMFLEAVKTGKYDLIWILNDTFIVEEVAAGLPSLFQAMRGSGLKVPKILFYYPIDCQILPDATSMLKLADRIVAYCQFGKEETLKVLPELENKLSIINHGTDVNVFKKLPKEEKQTNRINLLKIEDENTFLWVNFNRNTMRKDLAKTIYCFKLFKDNVPNSKLYLHTLFIDNSINLKRTVRDAGLIPDKDVLFPHNYSLHNGYPDELLNRLYNTGDAFVTTSLGEGWGLSTTEAMSCELPIVAPNNTCFTELLGSGYRGYLYSCPEKIWIDASGYRSAGRVEDILGTMLQCYDDVKNGKAAQRAQSARMFVENITWDIVCEQWKDAFTELLEYKPAITDPNWKPTDAVV